MNKSILTYLAQALDQYRADRAASAGEATPQKPGRVRAFLRWLTPNGGTLLLVALLVLTQNVWAWRTQAPAAPGPSATTVNYQGRLADSDGNPLDGVYGMTFALYDAPTGGNPIWTESHTAVTVSDGLFSVGLGSQTPGGIPTSVWDGDRYLEVTVGGETLSPRELIRSVPIAGMALTVPDGSITSRKMSPTVAVVAMNTSSDPITLGDEDEEQTVVSTNLSVDVPSRVWLVATCDFQTDGGLAIGHLVVDGVAIEGGIHSGTYPLGSPAVQMRHTVSNNYVFDLEPGTHTIELRVSLHHGVGSGWVWKNHTRFSYIVMSQ